MDITEWFDIRNDEHLDAYRHLNKTGAWPEGFLPADIDLSITPSWQFCLMSKLAKAYLDITKDHTSSNSKTKAKISGAGSYRPSPNKLPPPPPPPPIRTIKEGSERP